MNARDAILQRLRAARIPPVALPPLEGDWIRYPDPVEQFRVAVARAAGRVVSASSAAQVPVVIAELEVVRAATVCCSLLSSVPGAELPPEPSGYRHVEVLVLGAELGVAENGAVWLDGARLPARAGVFLAEHLVITLAEREIVDNMHVAYERLGARLGEAGYGCFMSGPSKTADIEQALVIGAQGPRSLTLVCY